MGNCLCLWVPDDDDDNVVNANEPSQDERRRQMAEAAERRAQNEQSRGVKDPGSVKRLEQKRDDLEKREAQNVGTTNEPGLRWTST